MKNIVIAKKMWMWNKMKLMNSLRNIWMMRRMISPS